MKIGRLEQISIIKTINIAFRLLCKTGPNYPLREKQSAQNICCKYKSYHDTGGTMEGSGQLPIIV
jgi:hypothetical protein